MDPLIPTTSTLAPAISHISETAASLAESLHDRSGPSAEAVEQEDDAVVRKQRQRETVRWVLAAPNRLKGLVEKGRRQEAEEDWEEVRKLLRKWKGVEGAEEVEEQCLEVMNDQSKTDAG